MDDFLQQIENYHKLSGDGENAFMKICTEQHFTKGSFLQRQNEPAKSIYFIRKGLVGYFTSNRNGDITFKMFFAEGSFVSSTAALINDISSDFSIVALEDCDVIKYSAAAFRKLYQTHHDIALFHIAYLEKNWIVKKEPLEIAFRNQTAKERYFQIEKIFPFYSRLKMHHIASYLGITPTQLSRIRKGIKA